MRYPIDEKSRKPYKVDEKGKIVLLDKALKPIPDLEKVNEEKLRMANKEIEERAAATNPVPPKKEEPKKEEPKKK